MKQLLQSFKSGDTWLEELPLPKVQHGMVGIRTTSTLVSLGTERMLVEFGKANLIQKARQQPEKVKLVLDKIQSEGLIPTINTVFKKLEQPIPLGYCHVGVVDKVGYGVSNFQVGDRVISNGSHAEYVVTPENLVAKIPDNVPDDHAAFTVVGAIGLQGLRLVQPTFGERVVVIGLGLIGLLTAQLLKANGCRVIGVEPDEEKRNIAEKWDIQTIDPTKGGGVVEKVMQLTDQVGADAVIITASSKSSDIISQAAQMSRRKGRIVLVGVVGLDINRADFYEKELSFQVSCSYGPGRYDEDYEQKGRDYPIGYVRWTEQRNFQAVLNALSEGSLKVDPLISQKVPFGDFEKVYKDIGSSDAIASLFTYDQQPQRDAKVEVSSRSFKGEKAVLGIIGAGNFTKMTMLPHLKKANARIKYIASSSGLNASQLAKKYKIQFNTTDHQEILKDEEVNAVIITTRHNSHASLVIEALRAGKHVFVEKPLALNEEELNAIIAAYEDSGAQLMLGFNRRFSPHIQSIKEALGNSPGALNMHATMNAGHIPKDAWVHDPEIGGGRIIGEACHHIDLCAYLANAKITKVCMNAMGNHPSLHTDNASILLGFENGSQAVVNYFANGHKSYAKERLEVYSSGQVFTMNNFRRTKAYGAKGFKRVKTRIDKGHNNQFSAFITALEQGGDPLIPFEDIINSTKASFAALESLKKQQWVEIN